MFLYFYTLTFFFFVIGILAFLFFCSADPRGVRGLLPDSDVLYIITLDEYC